MSGAARIAVLGAGAWGTALALALARDGRRVSLFGRDVDAMRRIAADRENPRYLPGVRFDADIAVTASLEDALDRASCVLVATPAQTLRAILDLARPLLAADTPIVLCAKGIDMRTGELLSTIAARHLGGNPLAALSGPSFAIDVARGLPTAVTLAAADLPQAAALAAMLSTPVLRCYSSDDLDGVQAGGALKNVMAIAAGAVAGAGLGASAQAATVTRGFVELRRLAGHFGARPETLMGLSGLGDLILTCNSPQSRNYSYGMAIGRGENLEGRPLAEGVATAGIVARLAARHDIDAPIAGTVAMVLDRGITVGEAVSALLSRPLKSED